MADIPVADPLEVNYNVPPGANVVLADEIPDDMVVIMETERLRAIELARRLGGVDLVNNEVMADAITRQHVIVARHSAMEAAPVWANVMLTQIQGAMAQMQATMAQMQATMAQMQAPMAQMQATMAQIQATMAQMQARAEADRARVRNSHINNPNYLLYPVQKYMPGHPAELPPALPNFQFDEPQYDVGVQPPYGLVPQTLKGIHKVSTARMNAIYWFYNDPLLAPGGQNLDARRDALDQLLRSSW